MTRRRATISLLSLVVSITVTAVAAVNAMQAHPLRFSSLFPAATQTTQTPAPGFYKVARINDGDTIVVDMDGKEESVRFIGVDTPETHKPDTPVQCFGPEASDFTTRTLQGKTVRLEADPTNDNRDRYGRLLRYVYLEDGTLLDRALIEQGYGFAYLSFPFLKHDEFKAAQDAAQKAGHGLWAACQTIQEKSGRWQTAYP